MRGDQFVEYEEMYNSALDMVNGDKDALEAEGWLDPGDFLLYPGDGDSTIECLECSKKFEDDTPSTKENPLGFLYCPSCR